MREEPYNKAGAFESVIIRRIRIAYPETDPSYFDELLARDRRAASSG